MAKDNLLKEAIADAKAVKETAIANAMLTLKESFKPQLSSMLATRLRNEELEEQTKLDSSDIGVGLTVDEPAPKKPASGASSSSNIDNPDQEVETFGEGFDDFGDDDEDDNFDSAGAGDDFDAQGGGGEFGQPDPMDGDSDMDPMGDVPGDEFGGEDDLDLEAIIRELEADLLGNDQGVGEATFGDDPHLKPESFVKGADVSDADAAMKLEGEAEGVESDGKDLPDVHGVPGGKKLSSENTVTEDDEEVDLEEILREVDAESSLAEDDSNIASENVELKRSLREHREVIKLLRTRINEVTLLNSKLMYTTKIFRAFNLAESQKKKVVSQFDRATTLRETKIVYSTLCESLTGRVSNSTTKKVVSKITEGASKSVGSTKPKSQTVISEGTTQVSRMQKLAGIRLDG